MGTIAKLLVALGIDAGEYDSGITRAAERADNFASTVVSSAAPAVAAGFTAMGLAAGAFAVTSVNAASDFEAGMLSFGSVTGKAITDAGYTLDDFEGKFLELGATTAFSAAEAQQAAIELAKGGVAIPSIMNDATSATLDLASAGGLDLAAAAGIVAKQLGVWADQGVTATDVSNLLAQAANASTVDVDELAAGLANAQGTAETAGVEYTDLIQTMALLAPNFASASTAGTSLNNFLLRIQPSTQPAIDAMQDLGLMSFNTQKAMDYLATEGIDTAGYSTQDLQTKLMQLALAEGQSAEKAAEFVSSFDTSVFYDQAGAFVGMEQSAALLQNALSGLSEAEKTAALQVIFGNDAMGAAVALSTAGADGFNAVGAAMAGAGTAADQAAYKNQGFKFAIDSLLGGIETLQIILGGLLLPVLTAFVNDVLTPAISRVTEFATAIANGTIPLNTLFTLLQGGTVSVADTMQLFGGLTKVIGVDAAAAVMRFIQFVSPLSPIITQIGAVIANNWQPILLAVATVLGVIVVGAIGSMIASVLTIAAPIMAAVAIVGAMYAAYQNNFFGIRDLIDGVMSSISAVVLSVMSAVQAFWTSNGERIVSDAMALWQQAYQTISSFVNLISAIVMGVFGAVAGFITAHQDQIGGVLASGWAYIAGMLGAVMQVIQGIINVALGIIRGDWDQALNGLKQIASGVIQGLETVFGAGLDTVKGLFNLALEGVRSLFLGFVGDSNGLGSGIINGIIDGVKGGVNALVSAVQGAADAALNAAKDFLGIASPSKVFYAEVGKMIPYGTANAVYDYAYVASDAVRAMASDLTDSAQVGVGALQVGAAAAAGQGAAYDAMGAGAGVSGDTYNITAHYDQYQSERTLRDDLRMRAMMNGKAG
jgi:TP901 family phage tail tape measure protein